MTTFVFCCPEYGEADGILPGNSIPAHGAERERRSGLVRHDSVPAPNVVTQALGAEMNAVMAEGASLAVRHRRPLSSAAEQLATEQLATETG